MNNRAGMNSHRLGWDSGGEGFNLGSRTQLVRMRRRVHADKGPPFRVSKRLAADMDRRISSHRLLITVLDT